MQERIITIYCLCDEFLKASGGRDHAGTDMSTAEVMTTALVAADLFGGCFEQRHRRKHQTHDEGSTKICGQALFSHKLRKMKSTDYTRSRFLASSPYMA